MQRALFEEGCIYVGVPPLYKVYFLSSVVLTTSVFTVLHVLMFYFELQVERGKQAYYCYDDVELRKVQHSFPSNASYNIQRFKGEIGSMICFRFLDLENLIFHMRHSFWNTFLDRELFAELTTS